MSSQLYSEDWADEQGGPDANQFIALHPTANPVTVSIRIYSHIETLGWKARRLGTAEGRPMGRVLAKAAAAHYDIGWTSELVD